MAEHEGRDGDEGMAAALAELRELIKADGGGMEVVSSDLEGRTVELRLILEDAACQECVLPRELLERVALDVARRTVPDMVRVSIDDPREHPDFVPAAH
jgi:hypothetical protein